MRKRVRIGAHGRTRARVKARYEPGERATPKVRFSGAG